MEIKFYKMLVALILFTLFSGKILSFDSNTTFVKRCSSCHTVGKGDKVGPDLKDITKRRSIEWIIKFVKGPRSIINSGDKYAINLKNKFDVIMPDQELDDEQIKALVELIKAGGPKEIRKEIYVPKGKPANKYVKKYFFVFILFILFIFSIFFFKKKNKLFFYINISILTVGLIIGTIIEARKVALNQGYAPKQPIKYSHKVHAGEIQIPCLYCHFAARRGRHAGIPPMELCMNCHSQVKKDSDEIKKLTKALKENKPVKWIKVHHLPDFAYFNHSQHVEVAKLDCQKCHGPVETMEVLRQENSLSMGWCMDCHRRNDIAPPRDHKSRAGGDCSKCHY